MNGTSAAVSLRPVGTLLKWVAPVFAVAGVTCPLFFGLILGPGPRIFALALTCTVIALVQVAVVWLTGLPLASRAELATKAGREATNQLYRSFSRRIVFRTVASTTMFGPIVLIGCASLLGLPPLPLLASFFLPMAVAYLCFLIPTLFGCRIALRTILPSAAPLKWNWGRRESLTAIILPAIIAPAAATALALTFAYARLTTKSARELLAEASLGLTETAFAGHFAEDRQLSPVQVSRFSHLEPFAYLLGERSIAGLNRQESDSVFAATTSRPRGAVVNDATATGLAWTTSPSEKIVFGVRLSFPSSRYWVFVVLCLTSSAFLTGLVLATRAGRKMKSSLDSIALRIGALPDRLPPSRLPHAYLEFEVLDDNLDRLRERFNSMRDAQREAIESGRQSRDLQAQFFAGMSHDLRSPLNSVIGFTDLLRRGMEGELNTSQQQAIATISESAQQLMRLVADILDTSKIEAGRLEIERTWVSALELLADCAADVRQSLGEKAANICTDIQPALPPIFVDTTRIRQALVSVLSRAARAAHEGELVLKATLVQPAQGRKALRIELLDPQRAISEAELARLAEAFEPLEVLSRRSTSSAGQGIDIALAKDIFHLHLGELDFEGGRDGLVASATVPLDEGKSSG